MAGNLKKYKQLERYLKIKEMMGNGISLKKISNELGINYSYLHFDLSRKVSNMDTEELREGYNNALAEFSARKQKELCRKKYTSARPKEAIPAKRQFYSDDGIPLAYKSIFKTQEQYFKHLADQYLQGKIR
jgi:hypothetical protein